MKCPRDHTTLEDISADGIKISVCPSCHGLLLHQDQFEKIGEKTKIEYPKTQRSVIQILEEKAESPVNGDKMKVIDHDGIKIDVCLASNYLWLDHGELEALFKKRNIKTKLGSSQPFNVFDAVDALDLAEFVSELLKSVFDGASNLIDF